MPLRRLPRPQLLLPAWPIWKLPSTCRFAGNGLHKSPVKPSAGQLKAHLFEILFPEDSKVPDNREASELSPVVQGKERKLQWGTLNPLLSGAISNRDLANSTTSYDNEDILFGDQVDNAVRTYDDRAILKRQSASILILSNASRDLAETDFLRLSPRGRHIDGWAAGFIKVIPGRDPQTLECLGHYFILFSSDGAARAYADRVTRLHDIAKRYTFSPLPLPPSYVKDGEDISALVKAFTLIPASHARPHLTLLKKPFRPAVQRLLSDGALPAIANQQAKSDALVLLALDRGNISAYDLEMLLGKDGRARNRLWALWGGATRSVAIYQFRSSKLAGMYKKDPKLQVDVDHQKQWWRPPSRFIIAFQDMKEARRFVRAWHRRQLPELRDGERNAGDEVPPLVRAELLW